MAHIDLKEDGASIGTDYNLFAVSRPMLQRLGSFDENIWPAYFEVSCSSGSCCYAGFVIRLPFQPISGFYLAQNWLPPGYCSIKAAVTSPSRLQTSRPAAACTQLFDSASRQLWSMQPMSDWPACSGLAQPLQRSHVHRCDSPSPVASMGMQPGPCIWQQSP